MAAPYVNAGSQSAEHALVVTPSDSTQLPATRGVWVGGAGNVAVTMSGDNDAVTFSGVPAGTLLPIRATQIKSTGTTATLILALY